MTSNMKQHHLCLLLTSILLAIATCSSAQQVIDFETPVSVKVKSDMRYGTSNNDSMCIPKWDYDIIKGDRIEYRKYREYWMHSEYDEQKSCDMQRERLMYAFIMAEVYRDTLAAFDFTQQIDFMKISVDSTLGAKVIEFLEMAAKSKPSILSFSAARKLREIYKEGLYGILPDMEKFNYYSQLSDSIIKSIQPKKKAPNN
jgi:hypothetical protein